MTAGMFRVGAGQLLAMAHAEAGHHLSAPVAALQLCGRVVVILTATLLWATGSFTFFVCLGAVLRHTAGLGLRDWSGSYFCSAPLAWPVPPPAAG